MDADTTKLADLRRRIARGEYEVDPHAVADAMLARLRRDGGWRPAPVTPDARTRADPGGPRPA